MSGKSNKNFSITRIALVIFLISFFLHSDFKEDNNDLTLNSILVKVLKGNSDLAAFRYEVRSKDGQIYQQSRLANPEFEFGLDNFAGSGELGGFGRSEFAATLSQKIPTAGKRSLAEAIAKGEKSISELNFNRKAADLLLNATIKFYELYFLQEKISLKKRRVDQIESFKLQILKRVSAGKTLPVELSRIKINLLRSRAELRSILSEFYSNGIHLATLWGENKFPYRSVSSMDTGWEKFHISEEISEISNSNPDLIVLKSVVRQKEAQLSLEKAVRVPDITLSGGVKRHFETGLTAFTAGISIPVPVFNTNKGGVSTAGYLVSKADSEFKAEELRLKSELKEKFRTLRTELGNLRVFKNKIIPESENTLKIISEAYSMGRSDYLEVIDVYDSVYEIKEEYIRSIRDRRIEMAEIERLNGGILNIMVNRSENEK